MATPSATPPRKASPTRRKAAPASPSRKVSTKAMPRKAPVKVNAAAPAKPVKHKLVRDSFTMPQQDFDLIDVLKKRAIAMKRPAKKSELLRAGLHALNALTDRKLHDALESLVKLKTGRPRKER